jgi:hypothetical protein
MGTFTVIDNKAYKQSIDRKLIIRYRWKKLYGKEPNTEVFRNIKSYSAAVNIISKRNKDNIKSAIWNGKYICNMEW